MLRKGVSLVACLLLAACGSTVQVAGQVGLQGEASRDGALAPAPARTSSAQPSTAAQLAVPGLVSRPLGAAEATGPSSAAVGVAAGPVLAAGSTSPVEIGIGLDGNEAAFAAAFGASYSGPDQRAIAGAVVADINAHGGLAGHRLQPVYASFDDTGTNWSVEDEAMCATFTQDHHVLAAFRSNISFGLDACLAQKRVPLVFTDALPKAASYFSAYPGLRFSVGMPTADRLYPAAFTRLRAQGWWVPTSKVGVINYDRPDANQVVSQVIKPQLARVGIHFVDQAAVYTPNSVSDVAKTESDMQSAIVRFRAEGITHVVFTGQQVAYLFLTSAKSQSYSAKYTLFSSDLPQHLKPSYLPEARGLGWSPLLDGLKAGTPGAKRCARIARQLQATDQATLENVQFICDGLYFLKDAYDAAGYVGGDALLRGATAFRSALTMGSHFDPFGGGGPAVARDLYQDPACTCLKYGSQVRM